jgi:hypothetical protein
MTAFNYTNTEVKQHGGSKIVRNVTIKRGNGHKRVTKYTRSKKVFDIKKKLNKSEVARIKKGKFIPGLFKNI